MNAERDTSADDARTIDVSSTVHSEVHARTVVDTAPLNSNLLFVLNFATADPLVVIVTTGASGVWMDRSTNAVEERVVLSVTVTVYLDVVLTARKLPRTVSF